MSVVGTLSVRAGSFPLGRTLGAAGVRVELERTVRADEERLSVWAWTDGVERYVETLRRRTDRPVSVVDRVDGGARCLLERPATDETTLFELASLANVAVLSARGDDERWSFRVRAGERAELDRLRRNAAAADMAVGLADVGPVAGPATVESALTDRQRRTLMAARRMGYYDTPRRATLADLGEEFGVTPRAVSQRLRRGVGNLVAATLPVD
jgi:hypothetical protein